MALLGCIADTLTGGTGLAALLVRNGMRTTHYLGLTEPEQTDALVVTPAAPVRDSLAALRWLQQAGCRQFYLSYRPGLENAGPVGEALIEALGCGFTLACPANPASGHTVYQGHLFTGKTLPPDANLLHLLGRQTSAPVGLVPYATVDQGALAIRRAMTGLKEQGRRWALVDALTDTHLRAIAEAAAPQALLTGGPALAAALPENFRRLGWLPPRAEAGALPAVTGPGAVIAGSSAPATRAQIGRARAHDLPVLELDPLATPDAAALTAQAMQWATERLGTVPVVIAPPAVPEPTTALVQQALAGLAVGLVRHGVRRLVVAGSDTAAAVAASLELRCLRIGDEIDPGLPWSFAESHGTGLLLALKSGESGPPDFFLNAFATPGQD